MFGADTPLVMDALQIAALAAAGGAGAIWLILRRRKPAVPVGPVSDDDKLDLESRVRVLERIATDRAADLAEEIEALRDEFPTKQFEGEAR